MAKTVADQFAETLAAAGVRRIYGIVGDSLNGLTDAIRRFIDGWTYDSVEEDRGTWCRGTLPEGYEAAEEEAMTDAERNFLVSASGSPEDLR